MKRPVVVLIIILFGGEASLAQIFRIADTVEVTNKRAAKPDEGFPYYGHGMQVIEENNYYDLVRNKYMLNLLNYCNFDMTDTTQECLVSYYNLEYGVRDGILQQYNNTKELVASAHFVEGKPHGLAYIFCESEDYPYCLNPTINPRIIILYRYGKQIQSFYLDSDSGKLIKSRSRKFFWKKTKNWTYN